MSHNLEYILLNIDKTNPKRVVTVFLVFAFAVLDVTAISNQVWAETLHDNEPVIVRDIIIKRMNIFGEESTARHLAPRLINRFHVTTRESVIRREIWFLPGQLLNTEDVDELERNIRDLDLFAQVDVETVVVDAGHDRVGRTVDILISTRDRLSIVASTGGSFLGGIGEVSASVGEKNLFGIGHSIEFGYKENTEGELLGSFAYDNVRFAGSDVIAGIRLGQTEEGNFAGFKVRNEFDNSDDQLAWNIEYDQVETRIDYYDQGESVAEVPRSTNKLSLNRIYRRGDRSGFWRYGPLAEYEVTDYSAATGAQKDSIIVPDDSTEIFVGGLLGYNIFHDYVKVRWLDTLDYEQDLSFGYGVDVALGVSDTLDDSSNEINPAMYMNSWWRGRLGSHEFISSKLKTHYEIDREQKDAWSASVVAKFYSKRFNGFTLASSLRYATGFSGTGLLAEQSLGEDNGLRGYPAREFNGEQSMLLNLESRIGSSLQLLTFRLGTVVFIDAGWVGDRNQGDFLKQTHTSAGFGARVGSTKLLGSAVLRLDVAFPFDQDIERDYKPSLSLSLGQVFAFN